MCVKLIILCWCRKEPTPGAAAAVLVSSAILQDRTGYVNISGHLGYTAHPHLQYTSQVTDWIQALWPQPWCIVITMDSRQMSHLDCRPQLVIAKWDTNERDLYQKWFLYPKGTSLKLGKCVFAYWCNGQLCGVYMYLLLRWSHQTGSPGCDKSTYPIVQDMGERHLDKWTFISTCSKV